MSLTPPGRRAKIDEMKTLTVKQPWASLIASGRKRVENRSWRPPAALIGQRIAIHAGLGWDKTGERYGLTRGDCPAGRIVCTAVIERVLEVSDDEFWRGPLGWALTDIRPATSGPLKGRLSLWESQPQAR